MGRNDKVVNPTTTTAPLQSVTLNDETWEAFVFGIFPDAQIASELANGRFQQLCDWVSSGVRVRFTVVQKADLVAWALENAKNFDACREVKAAMDAGATETDIPDAILARLVKTWFIISKQEGVESKNLAKGPKDVEPGPAGPEDPKKAGLPGKRDADKDKERVKSSNIKKTTLPGAKPVTLPSKGDSRPESAAGSGPNDGKRKTKLRDRGAKGEQKIVSIGDEPLDGPDVYYLLNGFDSPAFYNLLVEENEVCLNAVIRFEDSGPVLPVVTNSKNKNAVQDPNANAYGVNLALTALKNIASKSSESSFWRQTAWISMLSTEVRDHKEVFDIISKRVYNLLERKQMYDNYYETAKSLVVPEFNPAITVKNDLRYYDYLIGAAVTAGRVNVELVLSLLLEQLAKAWALEEDVETEEINSNFEEVGWLTMYFDKAAHHLAITDKEYQTYSGTNTKASTVKLVPWKNEALLTCYFLDALHSLGINPTDLLARIQSVYSTQKFIKYLSLHPLYSGLNASTMMRESLLFKTEVDRSNGGKVPEHTLDRLVVQLEFENLLKEKAGADMRKWNLDAWTWMENHDAATFSQVIQAAKVTHPIVYEKLSKRKGALLLALASPGEIGAMQHQTSNTIQVATKLAFSAFNETLDNNAESESIKGVGNKGYVYIAGDQVIRVQEDVHYMYPAFDVILKVTKRKSKSFASDCVTSLAWNNNMISFQGESKTKSGVFFGTPVFFTASFEDGSVFSMNKAPNGINVTASTSLGQAATFFPDRRVCQKYVGKSVTSLTKKHDNESGRMIFPTGKVIKYMEDGSVDVLFPDGSIYSQSTDGEIYRTKHDGTKTQEKSFPNKTEQLKVANDKHFEKNLITMTREDMVVIEISESHVVAKHADGTTITTHHGQDVKIESPGLANVTIGGQLEEDVIEFGKGFVIRRLCDRNNMHFVIEKNDLTISIDTNGTTEVKLGRGGLENVDQGANVLALDWLTGVSSFKDINGAKFCVDDQGNAKIEHFSNQAGHSAPLRSFGGRILKDRVKSAPSFEGRGNIPLLFMVNVDGSGMELLRDDNVLQHFQGHQPEFYQSHEEIAGEPGAIALTNIAKLKTDEAKHPILLFRQLRYFTPLEAHLKRKVEVDLAIIEARKDVLSELPREEPERVSTPVKSVTSRNRNFIYGQDKAMTEEAIVLKYLLKEDLAIRKHATSQEDDQDDQQNTAWHWSKPRRLNVVRHMADKAEACTKDIQIVAQAKMDKHTSRYFESPEGKQFLAEYREEERKMPAIVTVETVEEVRPKTTPVVESDAIRPLSGTQSEPAYPVTKESKDKLTPATTNSSKNRSDSKSVTINDQPTELTPPTPGSESPKRKVPLPAVLKASKPGAVPNQSYIDKEKATKREVNTASTAPVKARMENYGLGGFVLLPAQFRFGKVVQGKKYVTKLHMTNVGIDSTRFIIKKPANKAFTVEYKPGPVAPGMKIVLSLTFDVPADVPSGTVIEDQVQVVSEAEILHIPIHATVLDSEAFKLAKEAFNPTVVVKQ